MSVWSSIGFTGGGGVIGGGLISGVRILWRDKKTVEKEYKLYRAEAIKYFNEAQVVVKKIVDDLEEIKDKLGVTK